MNMKVIDKPVLTVKELAERWSCGEQSIRDRIATGELKPIKKAPNYRFSLRYIQELEEVDCSPLSAREKRRLQKELVSERNRANNYKAIIERLTEEFKKAQIEIKD